MDDARSRLWLDDVPHPVERAELVLHIATEQWRETRRLFGAKGSWVYGTENLAATWLLEVTVNEESGEDGAPAPSFEIPITGGAREITSLADFEGWRVTPGSGAFFGNDAPGIDDNVITFGPWLDPSRIKLHWTGTFDDWSDPRGPGQRRRGTFRFEGPVAFAGIQMTVKDDGDAEPFLAHLFPNLDPASLTLHRGGEITYGAPMPRDRRRWRQYIWTRVGAPAPDPHALDPQGARG